MRTLTGSDLLKTLCLLLVVLMLVPVGEVCAAEDGAGNALPPDVEEELWAGAESLLQTAPHPVLNDGAESPETDPLKVNALDSERHLNIPYMAAFQQMANSASVKDKLKQMIPSQVAVLYSTLMMVENGAATGFMQSMGTVGSLVSQTMQNSQLQMQLYGVIDPTGEKQREYVEHAIRDVGPQGQNKDFWPAALWSANGDKVQATPPPAPTVTDSETGATPADTVVDANGAQTGGQNGSALYVTRLFDKVIGEQLNDTVREKLLKLKNYILDWVGDTQLVSEREALSVEKLTKSPEKARQFVGGGSSQGPANVFEYTRKKLQEEVWQHLNNVMKQYCEFKRQNRNNGARIFAKKLPAESIEKADWKKIFSTDVQPSINLIDQLFKLFLGRRPIEEIQCDTFSGTTETMPDYGPDAGSNSSIRGGGNSFDSCEEKPKSCLRNQILYRITVYISESKLNHFYRWMWDGFYGIARNPADRNIGMLLFCKSLGLGEPCEPNHEFSLRLEENRVNWVEFSNRLSKFAQGQGGSTVFRPATSYDAQNSAGAVGVGGSGGR